MKILERLALILFSIIMMIIAVTSCLIVFDFVELKSIYNFFEEVIADDTACKVIIVSSVIAILLSIKALFFPSKIKKKQEIKTGVLLENKDGRLLISKDTIENLVNSVVRSFQEAIDIQTKISLDAENNITVFISLLVKENSLINELSSNIQNRIKDTIKRSIGLDINQININIRDIENSKVDTKNNNQTKVNINNVKINQNQINESREIKQMNEKISDENEANLKVTENSNTNEDKIEEITTKENIVEENMFE